MAPDVEKAGSSLRPPRPSASSSPLSAPPSPPPQHLSSLLGFHFVGICSPLILSLMGKLKSQNRTKRKEVRILGLPSLAILSWPGVGSGRTLGAWALQPGPQGESTVAYRELQDTGRIWLPALGRHPQVESLSLQ